MARWRVGRLGRLLDGAGGTFERDQVEALQLGRALCTCVYRSVAAAAA